MEKSIERILLLSQDLKPPLNPAALASFPCRSSKVQNRSALSYSAHATCNVSSVPRAIFGPCWRASSAQRSKAPSGIGTCIQRPCATCSSRWAVMRCDSDNESSPRNTCWLIACAHSALWSGVNHDGGAETMRRRASGECRSFRYNETTKLVSR